MKLSRKTLFYTAIIVLIIAFVFWLVGLSWFLKSIPSDFTSAPNKTDAIVTLTGGTNRLETALTLLKKDKAKKLLISGVGSGSSLQELLKFTSFSQEDIHPIRSHIDLGYAAKSTIGNAAEAKAWMEENAFDSLRLVTANYHIPRSLHEFAKAMPETTIITHPVDPEDFSLDHWWSDPQSRKVIFSEYHKLLFSYLR